MNKINCEEVNLFPDYAKENTRPRKMKLDVDFHTLGATYDVKAVFNALIKHNGSGKSRYTASKLVLDAFNRYNPAIDAEVIKELEHEAKAEYLNSHYTLACKEDVLYYMRNADLLPEPDTLKAPYKRIIIIDLNSPGGEELYNLLRPLCLKERAICIYKYLRQYLVVTKNEHFIRQISNTCLLDLRKLYLYAADTGTPEANQFFECAVSSLLKQPCSRCEYRVHENSQVILDIQDASSADSKQSIEEQRSMFFGRTQRKFSQNTP